VQDGAREEVPDDDVAGFAAAEDDAVAEAEGATDAVVGVFVLLGGQISYIRFMSRGVVRSRKQNAPQELCRL